MDTRTSTYVTLSNHIQIHGDRHRDGGLFKGLSFARPVRNGSLEVEDVCKGMIIKLSRKYAQETVNSGNI